MKKVVIMAVGLGLICTAAMGQQVLSRNAVGYVKVNALSNKLVLARVDFEPLDGTGQWTVSNLIGSQIPVGSGVAVWDRVNYKYLTETRTRSGWLPGTNVIRRGESFFIRSADVTNVYLMGEVPDRNYPDTYTTVLQNVVGMSAMGYPYPVSQYWTNMGLALNGEVGDSIATWDSGVQQYVTYTRTRSGWLAATNLVFQPGEGFWFRTTNAQTWVVVKPYTWP